MSFSKFNRIGFIATSAVLFTIAAVQGCSSSGDDSQTAPSNSGTGGVAQAGSSNGGGISNGGNTGHAGSGNSAGDTSNAGSPSNGGSENAAGTGNLGEAGQAGAPNSSGTCYLDCKPATCTDAEDAVNGTAAVLAANGGKLPALP